MPERPRPGGASPEAIQAHYDVGNEFYALWLDPELVYTSAMWTGEPGEGLEAAQARKIDTHLGNAHARGAKRLLDVGCGWGAAMRRAVDAFGVEHAVGLTLSPSQVAWVQAPGDPRLEVRLESWEDHLPPEPYDAIISVEAFEAFARQGLSSDEKIAVYRRFFDSCHRWLRPGGRLGLQVISYGNAGSADFDAFIAAEVFPESDLPQMAEVLAACERRFEVRSVVNDREGYVLTLRAWLRALKARRAEALLVAEPAVVKRFEQYLRLSIHMFEAGTCDLMRLELRRIDAPRPGGR